METLTIRTGVQADAPVIADFNALMALETEGRQLDASTLLRGVEAVLGDPSKGMYYVAEIGGNIAGQLMITYEWSDWRNGTFWWIQSVYVKKEYRNQGVFRSLYRHVEDLARQHGTVCGLRLYVDARNDRAKEAYRSLGLRQASYEVFEVDFVLKP